ncbi:MAG TPA: hypothetical protein VKA86_00365 [Candidatus Krumholzibacteria bacterium]|nr:hypothetical protein [Candidatus Krumholzibacteria bacterium]
MNVLLRLFLVLITTTLAAGCDDDDSPTAPSASSPSLFVLGSVSASGGSLSGWIEAWDMSQTGNVIDSVRVDGRTFAGEDGRWFYWAPEDGYWVMDLRDMVDREFAAGDTVVLELLEADESAIVPVPLLDRGEDRAEVVSAPVQSVPIGSEPLFAWTAVEGADFYLIEMGLRYLDDDRNPRRIDESHFVTGTSVAASPAPTTADGELKFVVTPYRGPMPSEGTGVDSNVRTSDLHGSIWSRGASTRGVHVVGSGLGEGFADLTLRAQEDVELPIARPRVAGVGADQDDVPLVTRP